ncbi:ras guanine nucleotide exchange factor domain-containing protein [Lactarius hengduanensis]|nr:ras guanine nucleotide exchange factor domain-containing protein [Lactarius hengduanensis]
MSPQDIVPAAGLNEIGGSGVLIAASLIRAAKNVKIYRSQCGDLSRRCLDLVSALQDHSPGLEGTRAQQAVDEVERVLTHIHKRVAKWAELGKMKSFVKQTEIKAELDSSYRELEACSVRFNISLHLYASTRSKELEEIRRRDHDELIEMITRFLHNNNLLKVTLASALPEDAHSVVQAIEQELREADFGETQERELQENFSELSRWVEGLPPMVDLSGNVTRSDHPIATGGSQDIYTGEWTGQEVALAYPRNQTRASQERFRRQVEIWRTLRHPNVLPLLGIAYIGNFVYSVSPYMEYGNIMQYLKIHPEAHRVLLLSEIASATEYLHSRGIIHGDLRGTNVLLSRDSHAFLADFGCARVEEVEVTGPTEALTYGSTRWLAPELMTQSNYVPTTRNTDVWSFGMLCVEIFTDNVPFNHIPNEAFIPLVIRDGTLPTRPEGDIITKGLTDAMWDLMNRCWRREPESRPKMPEIRETIQIVLPTRSASQMGRSSSLISGLHPSGTRPSLLSSSRPAHSTGLTPSSAPLHLPISPTRRDGPLSEQSRRLSSPATPSFHKSPIFKDIPLSSSPPSQVLLKPIPSPPNPSPLSSSLQSAQLHLSTTPESQRSLSPSIHQPDWSQRSLPPPFVQKSSTSSSNEVSLLLEQVHITSPSNPGSVRSPARGESTSTGSGLSPDRGPATSSGSLLDAAARDPQPVLRRAPDGAVEAGTLEGLVDRLVTDTHDRARDNEFQRIFVATYRLFTTGEDLFKILKRRFDEMGDMFRFSHNRVSIRYSILLFLRVWLSTEGEHMDRELLPLIGTFASAVSGSDTMREVAREITDVVGKNMDVVAAPPVSPLQPSGGHRPGPPPSPNQFKAADIALSLTVIEGEHYAEISQADYVAHLRGAISKHVEFATKVNNRLVNWIKKKILGPEDVQKRASHFKHFVLVAEECRKLQNFSSMSTIVAALQSATRASSTQLVLTRESSLSKSEKQILRQLEDLLDPRGDHRTYREALNNIKSPFVIPWLAVHLHSLKTFYDSNPSIVIVNQRPLINFGRCALLLKRIGEVQRYRPPAAADLLEKHHPPQHHRRRSSTSSGDSTTAGPGAGAAALAWVKAELENAPNSISSEKFEARVKELAEKERRMRETRELELRALGFGPPTPRTGTRGSSVRSPPARNASLDTTHPGWV